MKPNSLKCYFRIGLSISACLYTEVGSADLWWSTQIKKTWVSHCAANAGTKPL